MLWPVEWSLEILEIAGRSLGYFFVVLLCLAGIVASCLSLFGAWLVALAAMVVAWLTGPEPPGWGMVIAFVAVAAALEGIEAVASAWGVKRRGGSALAGFAALVGGLAGMVAGGFIPIPVFGSLLGMVLLSFAAAYGVEHARLKSKSRAAGIAMGAVTARVAVIMLKVTATLAMIAFLFGSLLL